MEAQSKEKWLFSCSHMTANHHESERTRKITANWSNEHSNRKPEGLSIMMFGLHCSQRQHTKTTQSKIADESQVHQHGSHQYTTLTNCYAFQTTNEQLLRPSNELWIQSTLHWSMGYFFREQSNTHSSHKSVSKAGSMLDIKSIPTKHTQTNQTNPWHITDHDEITLQKYNNQEDTVSTIARTMFNMRLQKEGLNEEIGESF